VSGDPPEPPFSDEGGTLEQARLLIAIALSFLVFFLWNVFFVDREALERKAVPPETATERETPPPAAEPSVTEAPAPARVEPPPAPGPGEAEDPLRTLAVDTPLYRAEISEGGALFRGFSLKRYHRSPEKGAPLQALIDPADNPGSVRIDLPGWTPEGGPAPYRVVGESGDVSLDGGSRRMAFVWASPEGLRVEKTYAFSAESYRIGMEIRLRNEADRPVDGPLVISLTQHIPETRSPIGFVGPSVLVDDNIVQVKVDDLEEKGEMAGAVRWTALQDRYFMTALVPESPVETQVRLVGIEPSLVESRFLQPMERLAPGGERVFRYELYFGPKSLRILSGSPDQLDKVIDFGWFTFIAKPCVWVMNQLYKVVPNYGVAIIVLTLMIKVLLWPLGNKSYRSMAEMKKLQPLMTEIREKYKGDKKKMNEEMMGLYRTYKVNPMGGCLPMALQIPVFIALYRMLYESIELRHAPFFGWINDLSAPDRLFRFDISIPFMQPPFGIPVLTIVMGATMFLQQKMSPPPGDPAQAKMMMLMPVVFTVIFINFPAGLVLYWLVNNVVSVAQQYYVQKKNA
jgi:YidC/Oxa1 family membrane protein insertase